MVVLVARPTLVHQMAGVLPQTNGKRKISTPFPSATQIVDLTFDDDDDAEPAAKRQKSQPTEDTHKIGLPSRARDHELVLKSLKGDIGQGPLVAAKDAFPTPLHVPRQPRKHDLEGVRAFDPTQNNGAPSNSLGPLAIAATSSTSTPDSTLPSNWEEKISTDGKVYYINHRTQTTSWHSPVSLRPTEVSHQKALEASTSGRQQSKSRTVSESGDHLRVFRLPQTTVIKFEADASSTATHPSANSAFESVQKPNHQKKQSYDHTDVTRVKSIFSPSPRPASSSDGRPVAEPKDDRIRKRQSQRERKAPERLVTEKPSATAKAIILPSRSATPRTEIWRKEHTPPRSQISVVIPMSQHKAKQPTLHLEEDQSDKQNLLRDLKMHVTVAYQRAESVERYFGTTGFSKIYGTASDGERLKKIHKLQPKAKKVKRKDVKLDWGEKKPATTKPFKHDELVHPRERPKEIAKAAVLSNTSGPPLTFVNNIDDRQLNGKFQFISEYVIREGVKRQPAHLNAHVNCTESCAGVCSPSTCSCLHNIKMQNFIGHPVLTYHRRPDGLIVLNDDFITLMKEEKAWTEIVECNNNCRCDQDCYNRVVQRGRTLPLEIFMTKTCGFGLRSPRDIVRGQFIDVYLGEVVTEAMLIKRENAQEEGEPSYLFTLDWFNEKINHVHYQVDGANFGTPMRFVNHSCNANCSVFPVMLKEYDENIYGLAVFALKDIPAMTELTLDYAPMPDDQENEEEMEAERVRCQCGENDCRGWLWPKGTKRARRRKAARL